MTRDIVISLVVNTVTGAFVNKMEFDADLIAGCHCELCGFNYCKDEVITRSDGKFVCLNCIGEIRL